MSDQDDFEARFDARTMRTIKELDQESYKTLMVTLLGKIGLRVTASVMMDEVAFIEGAREGSSYLVMASRKPEHASTEGLAIIREKARLENRAPVLLVNGELDRQAIEYAQRNEISFADRPKLLLLLKKFELTMPLMKEIDRKILEKEGGRYLPSIGQFDTVLLAAEDALQNERFKEAVIQYDRALSLKPEYDLAWRERAIALMSLGENEEAHDSIRQAIHHRPSDPNHYYILGLVLHQMGRLEEELAAYESALRYFRRMPSALLNKGATLFQLDRKEEALKVFDEMLRYYPNDNRALNNRGLVLKSMGRTKEALEAFDSVASRDPTNLEALVNKAVLLDQIGSLLEAVNAWKEAVNADRKRADLWLRLGQAQKTAGMLEDASRSFGVAATLDAELKEALKQREEVLAVTESLSSKGEIPTAQDDSLAQKYLDAALMLQAIGEYEAALREIDRCMAFEPAEPEAYLRKATVLMDMGRVEEAISALTDGLRHHPKNEHIVLDLEAIIYRLGRKEESLRLLEQSTGSLESTIRRALVNLSLDKGEAAWNLLTWPEGKEYVHDFTKALTMMSRGRYQDAAELLKQLEAWFKGSPVLLNDYGVCLRYSGRLQEAEEVLHRTIIAEPKYADAWNNLGCVHYLQGAPAEAERCFREAVLLERRPEFLINLAMCQLGQNDLDMAQESFSAALQLDQGAEALNGLGIVAERKKENARALGLYEEALRKAPEYRDAQYNKARVKMLLKGE